MTEVEAINDLKQYDDCAGLFVNVKHDTCIMAINALEEQVKIKEDGFSDHLLNMGYTKGYFEAIDKFVTKAYRKLGCSEKELYCAEIIDEIAEQMKKGE